MGTHDSIDASLAEFLGRQSVFFVATAPLSANGHVNVSPKGLTDTFAILDEHTVAYLDLTGSGVETMAHLGENGRITVMFCAFDGPPRIVRLYGKGSAITLGHPDFANFAAHFPALQGSRAVIVVALDRIADSCGYGVPRMDLVHERDQMAKWAARKGDEGLELYRHTKNAQSIDGLTAWEG
ncbi:MAG: pyridoxamine 5'-phosphate oxidase family protein [Acidimicrobiales bacterium]